MQCPLLSSAPAPQQFIVCIWGKSLLQMYIFRSHCTCRTSALLPRVLRDQRTTELRRLGKSTRARFSKQRHNARSLPHLKVTKLTQTSSPTPIKITPKQQRHAWRCQQPFEFPLFQTWSSFWVVLVIHGYFNCQLLAGKSWNVSTT